VTTLLLTPMILLPFLGAALQALAARPASARWFAFCSSLISSILGMIVLAHGLLGLSPEGLTDRLPWVGSYAISYELSVDGMSRIAVLIVSLLFPVLIASEWERGRGARGLYALFLVLQGALLGAVCAQDLFLLFFFWALSSIPVFFLVGIWGGPGKEEAAFRALVTSAVGNALLFGALVLIYYSKEPHTFLIRDLVQGGTPWREITVSGVQLSVSSVAFLFICLGLALRAPVWPLHGWFTRLADEAPSSVSVAVAGAVVPCALQIFGKLTHLLFPSTFSAAANWIAAAGLINLLVGALAANAQRRLSSLISCLVLVQVGISLIALGSEHSSAMVGMTYHQLSSALAIAGLGLLFGALATKGRHPDLQESSGGAGLVLEAPVAGIVMALSIATLVGVPGLSGFVGQGLVLMGSYSSSPWIILPAGVSLLLLTTCLFGAYRVLFLGGTSGERVSERRDDELTLREKSYLLPLVGLMVVFGLYPKPVLDIVRPTAEQLLSKTSNASEPAVPQGVAEEDAPGTAPTSLPTTGPSPAEGEAR
jgi:NADH-quinone oxidoreductase subunit M